MKAYESVGKMTVILIPYTVWGLSGSEPLINLTLEIIEKLLKGSEPESPIRYI